MSGVAPLRRLTPRCLSYRPKIIASQRRAASKDSTPQENPVLDEYLKKNPPSKPLSAAEVARIQQKAQQEMVKAGDIAASSIFEDQQPPVAHTPVEQKAPPKPTHSVDGHRLIFDPDPAARKRWERKKVIQAMRKGGRMTREEMLKRTEREHLAKSENMKTSVKKLGMLARQIAGKTLDDAITQMNFSKKKAAISVGKHLLAAKDQAIVVKGMALPKSKKEEPKPVQIRSKEGKKMTITDPTKLYIDQAWVGRGPYGRLPDYRARGVMYMLRTPFTSLSVVLKEQATLVREYKDREEKRQKKRAAKLWQHLPDRPLQGPRGQYYSW